MDWEWQLCDNMAGVVKCLRKLSVKASNLAKVVYVAGGFVVIYPIFDGSEE